MPFRVECVALLGGLEQGPPRQELSSSSALALLMFLPETLFSGSLPESDLTHFYPISLDSALNLQGTPPGRDELQSFQQSRNAYLESTYLIICDSIKQGIRRRRNSIDCGLRETVPLRVV